MKNFYISTGQIDGDRNYQEDYLETEKLDDNASLLILADGMGGYKGGERASKTVVRTFKSVFDKSNPNIKEALKEALYSANKALKEEKIKAPDLGQMGTTLIAVYIHVDFIQWISVGDSPLWLISKRYDKRYHKMKMKRINKNHSVAGLLQLQLEHGEITKEEMESSPNKHMLTSAITGDELALVDSSDKVSINKDDILILASDGVETLNEDKILDILVNIENIETSADSILHSIESVQSPEQDNSSLIVITNKEKENKNFDNDLIIEEIQDDTKQNLFGEFLDKYYHLLYIILVSIIIVLSMVLLFSMFNLENIFTKDTVDSKNSVSMEQNKSKI